MHIKYSFFYFYIIILSLFFSCFCQFHHSLDAFNTILCKCILIRKKSHSIRIHLSASAETKQSVELSGDERERCSIDHILLEMHLRSWIQLSSFISTRASTMEFGVNLQTHEVPIYNKTHQRILSSEVTCSLTEKLVFCSLFFGVIHRFPIRPLLFPRERFFHFPILLFTLALSLSLFLFRLYKCKHNIEYNYKNKKICCRVFDYHIHVNQMRGCD